MSSNGFWDKTANGQSTNGKDHSEDAVKYAGFSAQSMVLDEEALAEVQGEEFDVFEDEEEDTAATMSDANLRLEQGRLYQMVLQGNIFADTNADPKAIRNVQRQIKKFVKEQMETMLGIRQEQSVSQTIISSPFNDLEVEALKMVASKVTKGASEETSKNSGPSLPPPSPKKDGITSISGALRPGVTPLPSVGNQNKSSKPAQKNQTKQPAQAKSAITKVSESNLKKPIEEMTPEELAAHNKAAEERSASNRSAMPTNMMPHPTPQQLEMMYASSAAQVTVANPTTRFRPY